MSEYEQDSLVDANTNADVCDKEMGQVKSQFKKFGKTHSKRQLDDFTHIKLSGNEHTYMCGVVEGFYGRPWTAEQRKELFRRCSKIFLLTN